METLNETVRGAFDKVFAELVHLERDRPPTRKRASLAAFTSEEGATTLIQALAGPDCRVLVTSGETNVPSVEVAHEKLFTAWPRLKAWIDQGGEALRLIEHAREEARRWGERGEMAEELWLATRATEVWDALQRFGKSPSPELSRFLRPQKVLEEQLHQDTLTHKQRAVIGWKLAQFGDPRQGVGLREDGLLDVVWVDIPGGQIKLENINHVFKVKPFRLAKYPVTNVQFEAFIYAEDGYHNKEWWKGLEQSEGPAASSWSEANCPRETVSWYEAVAFCRWVSHRTDSGIRLPTEWEWQQAATGGDQTYEYPWPGGWDAARCNCMESRLNRTTPVGIYLSGATQNGVMDMAGNVYEWCLNKLRDPEEPESADIDNSGDFRAIRGGSWYFQPPEFLRTSTRDRNARPGENMIIIGFRLAQDIS